MSSSINFDNLFPSSKDYKVSITTHYISNDTMRSYTCIEVSIAYNFLIWNVLNLYLSWITLITMASVYKVFFRLQHKYMDAPRPHSPHINLKLCTAMSEAKTYTQTHTQIKYTPIHPYGYIHSTCHQQFKNSVYTF